MWATPEFAWAHNGVDGKVDRDPKVTEARMLDEASQPDDDVQSEMQWHVIHCPEDGRLLACAQSFIRVVSHSGGVRMRVLGLGGVACAMESRGRGWGKAVVIAALRRLQDYEGINHFLFETAIPSFYEKLGARRIDKALVVNSTGNGVAFEDEYVMIFPVHGDKPWPKGEVDLLGPGY